MVQGSDVLGVSQQSCRFDDCKVKVEMSNDHRSIRHMLTPAPLQAASTSNRIFSEIEDANRGKSRRGTCSKPLLGPLAGCMH
jgi:hypothetical protein